MGRGHTCTPSWEVPNGHLAVHTGGRTPKHDGSDGRAVGIGNHDRERNEKGQRTEPIKRPTGDGVHRRAAGGRYGAVCASWPGSSPALTFGVRSPGPELRPGRRRRTRTDRVTAPDSGLRFTWGPISPSGSLAPATPRRALPPTTKLRPTQWLARRPDSPPR